LHGLLVIDIGLTVGYDSVVFRFIVEHGATVGDDVIIQGQRGGRRRVAFHDPSRDRHPDGAVITDEACLQEVLNDSNGERVRQRGRWRALTCRASLLFCSSGEIMARSDVGAPREVEW
jgi:hypothetical protein